MLIPLAEVKENRDFILESIKKGFIFIYPTDTIYGIGCDATNESAVLKLRMLKERYDKPLLIIAPSKKWIYENCIVQKKFEKYIKKLPGAFTFILKLKNKNCINKYVNMDSDSIGVRIPDHIFTKTIQESEKPFITTSVNISGKEHVKKIEEISEKIKKECIIIDAGLLDGKPSSLIDLTGDIPKILGR